MKARNVIITAISLCFLLVSNSAGATDKAQVYGSQLMTEQERMEHRQRMRNAESQEERDKLRAEHHKRMQERAKKQGVTLPDTPPAGGGMNKGKGMGGGQGGGQGSGKGQGMGRGKY